VDKSKLGVMGDTYGVVIGVMDGTFEGGEMRPKSARGQKNRLRSPALCEQKNSPRSTLGVFLATFPLLSPIPEESNLLQRRQIAEDFLLISGERAAMGS